jgi:hypothetical protein
MRRSSLALVVVLVVGALAGTAGAQTQPPAQYKGHGITFSYPATWTKELPGEMAQMVGTPLWQEWLMVGNPADLTAYPSGMVTDLVVLLAFRMPIAITPANFGRYVPALNAALTQFVTEAGATMRVPPARTKLGKLPALRLEVETTAPDGSPVISRLVIGFNKRTEYFLNCQHGVASTLAADVMGGCDTISRTFRVLAPKRKRP